MTTIELLKIRTQDERGFSLAELLVVLGLFGLFAVMATTIMITSNDILSDTVDYVESSSDDQITIQTLSGDLREGTVLVAEPNRLVMEYRDTVVTWEVDEDYRLTRAVNDSAGRHMTYVPDANLFERQGGMIYYDLATIYSGAAAHSINLDTEESTPTY